MDAKILSQIRDHLLQAAELLTAGINADAGVKEPCKHDDRIDLTTMGSDIDSFLCNSCGHSWEENVEKGIPAVFGTGFRPN